MTLLEFERAMASARRVEKQRAQERASYDYILGDLIGKSISRIYSSSARYPAIEEVYPSLFDDDKEIERLRQEQKAELSALRFKQFADSFNKRFKGGGKES